MKKIGELLVEREWLTREQLHQGLKHQQVFGGRLGTCLLELSLVSEDRLVKALSDQLGVPPATADDLRVIAEGVLEMVPAKMACRARVVPFERFGNAVSVALVDTRDLLVQDELGFVISKRLKIHVAPEVRVLEALEKHYKCQAESRFSRIWDRLNRSRVLWPEESSGSPGTVPAALRKAAPPGVAPPPSVVIPKPAWQPQPPPPLESGVTRLAAFGMPATQTMPPPAAPPPPPAVVPPVAPRPSPLLGGGGAVAPQPPVAAPDAPATAPQPEISPARPSPPAAPPATAAPRPSASPHADTTPLVVPKAAATLAELEERLAEIEERDDVAHAVLPFLERRFQRRLLFMVKGRAMAAWMGSGTGVDQKMFGGLDVPFDQPSLFLNLREGSPFYRGPLPRLDAHQRLVKVWGGKYPRECLLLPVRVRDRMVAAVYCDCGTDDLSRVDVGELQAMAAAMGHAFERYLIRKKAT